MPIEHLFSGPLFLDLEDKRVWRGEQHWQLTPKAFDVLLHLVEHSGRLVTKEELRVFGNRCGMPQYIVVIESKSSQGIAPVTIPTERLLNIPGIRVLSVKYDEDKIECQIESTQGSRDCLPSTSEIAGAAGGSEFGTIVARAGQES